MLLVSCTYTSCQHPAPMATNTCACSAPASYSGLLLWTELLKIPALRWCAMCRVTIFVVATEDAAKGCQITQTKGSAPEVISYEKRVCAYLSPHSLAPGLTLRLRRSKWEM